jgi:hypothetical protein
MYVCKCVCRERGGFVLWGKDLNGVLLVGHDDELLEKRHFAPPGHFLHLELSIKRRFLDLGFERPGHTGTQTLVKDVFLHHLELHNILFVALVLCNQLLESTLDLLVGRLLVDAKDAVWVLVPPGLLALRLLLAEGIRDHGERGRGRASVRTA